jgi:hypothetical protein
MSSLSEAEEIRRTSEDKQTGELSFQIFLEQSQELEQAMREFRQSRAGSEATPL